MALPFEVQIGRISRFLSKWASTKGSSPRVTMGSEVTPVLPFWSGVENRFLDSWNRYSAVFNVAALAGQAGAARIRNPAGSNVIAVVEKVLYFPVVAVDTANVRLGTLGVDLTVGTGNSLDFRNVGSSSLIVSQSSTGVIFTQLIAILASSNGRVQADMILDDNQEIVVGPGQAFQVDNTSVNVQFVVTMIWRERILEESERS